MLARQWVQWGFREKSANENTVANTARIGFGKTRLCCRHRRFDFLLIMQSLSTTRHVMPRLSPIDGERFGIRIARASDVDVDTLPDALAFCQANAVKMLVARCRVDRIAAAQAMERHGFLLMDTMLHYSLRLDRAEHLPDSDDVVVREIRPGEEEAVAAIAADTFGSYLGHYHADERLDPGDCSAVYVSWAYRSCTSRDVADLVLVAETEGEVAGFLTMKRTGDGIAGLPLAGVAARHQGRRIHATLHNAMVSRCGADGFASLLGSTQASNLAMQKNMLRAGWQPTHAEYTFHKWFDPGG